MNVTGDNRTVSRIYYVIDMLLRTLCIFFNIITFVTFSVFHFIKMNLHVYLSLRYITRFICYSSVFVILAPDTIQFAGTFKTATKCSLTTSAMSSSIQKIISKQFGLMIYMLRILIGLFAAYSIMSTLSSLALMLTVLFPYL